jgi:ATP synthase protein I
VTQPLTAADATALVLRASIVPTAAVGVVAMVVAALVSGSPGFVAALLATVVVVVFFASGQYAVGRILTRSPQLALTAGLLVYLVQILVLFVLIALLKDSTWLDSKVFALTVVLCTVAWMATTVWVTQRTKVLYVEPIPETASDEPVDRPVEP